MIKLPNGIGDYKTLVNKKAFYADRTSYIEKLESDYPERILFLRPRRFGKSLFLSTLNYYYGLEHKDDFQALFGDTYIGQNPTPNANQYLILRFNFSRIDTSTPESTFHNFLSIVKNSAIRFVAYYSDIFKGYDTKNIEDALYPQSVIDKLLSMIALYKTDRKVYVLIDEYDHFANELVAFHLDEFKKIVGKNGWVRKFYEEIKKGSDEGIIERIFITGIAPLTMDSLTSGFNIASNITLDPALNEMCGFTKNEVLDLLKGIDVKKEDIPSVLFDMEQWYNGYLFNEDATEKMYNPSMVLYFADQYQRLRKYPRTLLDTNIATDYTKLSSIFKIGGYESSNFDTLLKLLSENQVTARITEMYSFERPFTLADMISLLYYNGILTIKGGSLLSLQFEMPNFVISQLYYQYFYELITRFAGLQDARIDVYSKVDELAINNNITPLIELTERFLTGLSNRDKIKYDEKHLKSLFASFFFQAGYYFIFSEYEVAKQSKPEKGYADLMLVRRQPFNPPYQFIFEIKYLKKGDEAQLSAKQEEARLQLAEYMKTEHVRMWGDMVKYVLVFVGNKGYVMEIE